MEINTQTVGLRIKNRRKELHLTQNDIQATAGISSGNMSEIENGNRLPAATTLVQLANVLKCSIDWILTGTSSLTISSNEDPRDTELLNGFWALPEDEKEELIEILRMKLHKIQKSRNANSKSFNMINNDGMTG
ncbi:MAG: helix-turn-helix domain-containing protein [Lachnospiraceae bacterium]|nr:helix-turn-helix domain-containing protein [Lachnospiraceae bacterium]HBV83899.1 XRE family transcriptional regulator [Lachnospiraceae bacterium]